MASLVSDDGKELGHCDLGDHVIDEPVLVPYSGSLKVLLVVLLVDILERKRKDSFTRSISEANSRFYET